MTTSWSIRQQKNAFQNKSGDEVGITHHNVFCSHSEHFADYQPIPRPKTDYELSEENLLAISKKLRQLPPYNGFGSYEDSAVNCHTLDPLLNPPVPSIRQFLQESGYVSRNRDTKIAIGTISFDQIER